jgi:hypothetical protein
MTIVFSGALSNFIVMVSDSAVALDFEKSPREYTTGPKSYCLPGVGCVTTWGARDLNQVGSFLDRQRISSEDYSVSDLADLVYQYLTEEYRPCELGLNDMGYHMAGFDSNGHAHLYHVFWGFDRPKPPSQKQQKYEKYEHILPPEKNVLLYNGRNDLADMMVHALLGEVDRGGDIRFDLATPSGLVYLGDFVARFAAELTPEVGPPFLVHLISWRNEISRIVNRSFCPIDRDEVTNKLKTLGYKVQTNQEFHS